VSLPGLPLAEAAKRVGVSPVTLRKAVLSGQLKAVKLANRWFTTEADIQAYYATRRQRGRPRLK
jgi:predicted site-specific integrase-resolvase